VIAVVSLAGGWYVIEKNKINPISGTGEITGSITPAAEQKGPFSGLPLPRFVSLKSDKVNVRKGPSSDHAVAWVFHRKGMPVEIIAEFENWRKIRDSEGAEGWILQQMLSGKRSAIIMSYGHTTGALLHTQADPGSAAVASLNPGVSGLVTSCDGTWCEMQVQGFGGYVDQSRIWGIYPGELVE
jgi:SH3-like domain-containing protein